MNREQKIQKLRQIAKSVAADNPEVMIIHLYGSLVEGYAHGEGDIDLAVVIDKGKSTKDFLRQMTVFSEPFEAVFGEARIDLRVINDAPLTFKYNVISKGEVLFSHDPDFQEDFETPIQKEYWDFKPYLDEYFECLLEDLASRV